MEINHTPWKHEASLRMVPFHLQNLRPDGDRVSRRDTLLKETLFQREKDDEYQKHYKRRQVMEA